MNENIYILSDSGIKSRIGEKFRKLRLRQNETQLKIAEDTQLSLSTVKNIEKGKITSFDAFLRMLRITGKLDILTPLLEDEGLSPNEYYELSLLAKKRERKRASKAKKPNSKNKNKEEEAQW